MRALGEDRVLLILMFPLPKTLKQLRALFADDRNSDPTICRPSQALISDP
jgi:hypothetical protein